MKPEIPSDNSLFITCTYHKTAYTAEKIDRQKKT